MRRIAAILKFIGAGAAALAVLCALFVPYYTMPNRVPNALGNTNFVWPAGAFWMQAEEGISWGRADEQGFNNPVVVENPDVLLLGSSHMEAVNVRPDESAAQQLSALFGGEFSVYNMGMSGHDIPEVCHFLPNTLSAFDTTPKYIVIEARSLALSESDLDFIFSEPAPQKNTQPAWLNLLRNLPFLSALERQMDTGLIDLLLPARAASAEGTGETHAVYDRLMAYLSALQTEHGTQIIFMYHRPGVLGADGSLSWTENPHQPAFSAACTKYGIGFIDLADDFAALYANENLLPYGFITGSPNAGHLNAHGHRAAAGAIFRTICEMEG